MMLKASSLILLTVEGRVILQLRDDREGVYYRGRWGLIGGAALDGETPSECMVRECLEETGWRPDYLRVVFEMEEHCQETVFASTIDSLNRLSCYEGLRLEAFSLDDLDGIELSSYHKRIIDRFLSGIHRQEPSCLRILFYTKVLPPAFGGYVSAGCNLFRLLSSLASVRLVTDDTMNSLDDDDAFDVLFFNATYEHSDAFRLLSERCSQSWSFEHNEMTDTYYNEMSERFDVSSRILVASPFLKNRICQQNTNAFHKELTVLPIPIDSSVFYFHPNPVGNLVRFITCCAIKRVRNLDFILYMLRELRCCGVSFLWNIYGEVPFQGDPSYLNELRSLVDSLGLSESVRFHSALSRQSDISAALHQSDFYIDFASKETYGLAKIEAAMSGTRMILPPVDNNLIFKMDMASYVGSAKEVSVLVEETIRKCREDRERDIAERLAVRDDMMQFSDACVSVTLNRLFNETI